MKVLQTSAWDILHLQFTSNGTVLIVVDGRTYLGDRTRWNNLPLSAIYLVQVATGEEARRSYLPPQCYAVCPVTGRVAFVTHAPPGQERAEIYDPWAGTIHASFPIPGGHALLFAPGGKRLLCDQWSTWIDLETGGRGEAKGRFGNWACISPCGQYVAVGDELREASLWSWERKLKDWPICADGGMAWSSTGWLAWLRGQDIHFGSFRRGDVGEPIEVDETFGLPIIAFHPTGNVLYTGSYDGIVRLWDPARRECLREYAWNIGPITALAFSPDGLTCAAGGEKGQVVVWDVDG